MEQEGLSKRQKQEDIPYDKRPDGALRAECKRRGLLASGVRTTLIARLQNSDHGALAMPSVMVLDTEPAPVAVTSGKAPVFATGAQLLLGLPHEVIQNWLCCRLSNDQLLALLYSCTYLYRDALTVLQARAVAAHGPGGSVLSLTAQSFYEHMRDTRWAKLDALTRTRYARGAMVRQGIRQNPLVLHVSPNAIGADICYNVKQSGSLQLALAEHAQRVQRKTIKRRERETADAARQLRYRECVDYLTHQGYPNVFTSFSAAKRLKMHFLWQVCPESIVRRLRAYILDGSAVAYAKAKAEMDADANRMQLLTAAFSTAMAEGMEEPRIEKLRVIIDTFISLKVFKGIRPIVESLCQGGMPPMVIWVNDSTLPIVCARDWYTRGVTPEVRGICEVYSGRQVALTTTSDGSVEILDIRVATAKAHEILCKRSSMFICMRILPE